MSFTYHFSLRICKIILLIFGKIREPKRGLTKSRFNEKDGNGFNEAKKYDVQLMYVRPDFDRLEGKGVKSLNIRKIKKKLNVTENWPCSLIKLILLNFEETLRFEKYFTKGKLAQSS